MTPETQRRPNWRLYLSTARHLSAHQVWTRVARRGHRALWHWAGRTALDFGLEALPRRFAGLMVGLRDLARLPGLDAELELACARAQQIAAGQFTFLDRTVVYGGEPGWHDGAISQLWRYQLHYFGYLRDLALWAAYTGGTGGYEAFRRLATSWIKENTRISGDGWHPYTLSLRVVNWLEAMSAFREPLEGDASFRQALWRSLFAQAEVLSRSLEFDVRGNHLFENLRALLWSGLAIDHPRIRAAAARARSVLVAELHEQVRPDGGHFERCPGYHVVVLTGLLELGFLFRRNDQAPPDTLDDAGRRMLDYLLAILPPDGQVPLLKDTSWDAVPSPTDVLSLGAIYFREPRYKVAPALGLLPLLWTGTEGAREFASLATGAGQPEVAGLSDSGHYVLRDSARKDYVILDAGRPCPDYLPAHAHADAFTYELYARGRRLITDSGVFEYTAGSWRDFFRSTRAHNTVEVEGADQSEVWGSFRVGRRARVTGVHHRVDLDGLLVQAQHDGYAHRPPRSVHRRTVWARRGQFWLVVDELRGHGADAAVVTRVHLHPEVAWAPGPDGGGWLVTDVHRVGVTPFGGGCLETAWGVEQPSPQGWYSERFGQRHPRLVLGWRRRDHLPFCLGYLLAASQARFDPVQPSTGGVRLRFAVNGVWHALDTHSMETEVVV